jgi:integrase
LDEILKYEYPQYKGIMLFLYLGRRLNEVLTLKWDKIKFNTELDTYIIDAQYSKNRKIQIFPLSQILKNYLEEFGILQSGFIFKGIKTEHIVRSTFITHWKKVVLRANIDKMGIHDTRHLLGNTLINRGISEDIIGKVLGHQSFSITSRYATVNINTINEALNIYLEN